MAKTQTAPAPVAPTEPTAEEQAAAKAAKEAAAAAKKKAKDEAAEAKKAAKEAEKAAAIAKKAEEKLAKEKAKAEAKAAKEAARMPESNGIRRPKPDTLCGKAWAIFDEISAKNGSAASIGESLKVAESKGLNLGNVRAEYARWRKFYGVSGRVADPTAPAPTPKAADGSAPTA